MVFGAINKWRRRFGAFWGIADSNDVGSILTNDPYIKVNAVGTMRNTEYAIVSNLLLNGESEDGSVAGVIQNVTIKDINKGLMANIISASDSNKIVWGVKREIEGNETKLFTITTDKVTDSINYELNEVPVYANDAAADADDMLSSKALYRLTGNRAIYQKP